MNKIAENKTRYMLLIEKDLKLKLEHKAKKENRSLNNLINTVLKNYIDNKK